MNRVEDPMQPSCFEESLVWDVFTMSVWPNEIDALRDVAGRRPKGHTEWEAFGKIRRPRPSKAMNTRAT